MARKRERGSKRSFGGYELPSEIEPEFIKLVKEKRVSAKSIVRFLIREWVKQGGPGVMKF